MKKVLYLVVLAFCSSILIGQNYYMASPEGFGEGTTGGGNTTPITVSTYADLKTQLISAGPKSYWCLVLSIYRPVDK